MFGRLWTPLNNMQVSIWFWIFEERGFFAFCRFSAGFCNDKEVKSSVLNKWHYLVCPGNVGCWYQTILFAYFINKKILLFLITLRSLGPRFHQTIPIKTELLKEAKKSQPMWETSLVNLVLLNIIVLIVCIFFFCDF